MVKANVKLLRVLVLCFSIAVLFWLSLFWFESKSRDVLHNAVSSGDIKKVELLIRNGHDPNEYSNLNLTPLHCLAACPREKQAEMLSLLLKSKADPFLTTQNGFTIFQIAACNRRSELMYLLASFKDEGHNFLGFNTKELAIRTANLWVSISSETHMPFKDSVLNLFSNSNNSTTNLNPFLSKRTFKPISHTDYNQIRYSILSLIIFLGAWCIYLLIGFQLGGLIQALSLILVLISFLGFIRQGIFSNFFIDRGKITSFSMFPYADNETHVLVDIWNAPENIPRGSVISLYEPPEFALRKGEFLLKRLIAKPGDTVCVKPARIYLDEKDVTDSICGKLPLHTWLRKMFNIKNHQGIIIDDNHELESKVANKMKILTNRLKLNPGKLIINGKEIQEPYLCEDMDYSLPEFIVPPKKIFYLGDNRNRSLDGSIIGFVDEDLIRGKVIYKY